MKIETADPDPEPVSAPPIEPPSPTPSPSKTPVDCGKVVPVRPGIYWEGHAMPPATCKQATAVLPKALAQHPPDGDYTVDGWRCHSDSVHTPPIGAYDRITCTKGNLSVDMVFTLTAG